MQTTLNVDANRIKQFTKRVEQMQRKAVKLGFEPLKIVHVGEPTEREATLTVVEVGLGATECKILVREIEVMLEGTVPVFNGWTVRCRVDHTEDGNLVTGDAGISVEDIVNLRPYCAHCGQKRDRKKTYLIERDGGTLQVGGACLKDFTRSDNPEQAFNYGVELVAILGGEEWEAEVATGVRGLKIVQVLGTAIAIVERNGYTSASTARYDGVLSTKELVMSALTDKSNQFCSTVEDWDTYDEKAKRIIEWAMDQDSDNSYMHNVQILLKNTTVSDRFAGYIVGLVSAWNKMEARVIRETYEATCTNEHIGEVKERLRDLSLTVQMIRYFEDAYGTKTMAIMRDEAGRTFKWMASGTAEFNQGDYVTLDGTVKSHEEYNGTKQTVLTRCKIKEFETRA